MTQPVPIHKIRPVNDRMLVRRDDFDAVTAGGIVIPDIAKNAAEGSRQQLKRGRGTVLAVGPGCHGQRARKVDGRRVGFYHTGQREPIDVEPGDRIAFSILCDHELEELGHPDCVIIREDDIVGVLSEDE